MTIKHGFVKPLWLIFASYSGVNKLPFPPVFAGEKLLKNSFQGRITMDLIILTCTISAVRSNLPDESVSEKLSGFHIKSFHLTGRGGRLRIFRQTSTCHAFLGAKLLRRVRQRRRNDVSR